MKICNSSSFSRNSCSVQKQPPEVFYKKRRVLRNFTKFTGKHQCQSLFFNKVIGLRRATLLKKRLCHKCFPVNFVKFLRTTFSQNTSGRLLLSIVFLKIAILKTFEIFTTKHLCWRTFFDNVAGCRLTFKTRLLRPHLDQRYHLTLRIDVT